ncbi:nucleotidyltransferase domain-containing protein [Sulfuracidifex tepidarius]|uniref:nucleotidyltransferase domain-containing protein n=1 Tax=Sulfuracidifex tepidarius TaxID=1294262 RepID=UPI0006CF226B|nr:nucleotidyltransferase domain-containing protein [Sulfuracidifex tepidarius]
MDKDVVIDKEGKGIFQVITNYDTARMGFVFAMLKYERNQSGLWRGYSRVLKNYGVHNLVKLPQKFEYQPCLDVSFPIVYSSEIGKHLKPEEGLDKVIKGRVKEEFSDVILSIVDTVGSSGLGIGGSILTGLYHGNSDIDVIVYGKRSLEVYFSMSLTPDKEWIIETSRNYGISLEQARELYDPRRRGIMMGKKVSVNFVDERTQKLCDNVCVQKGKVSFEASVEKEQIEALFYPSIVKCDGSSDLKISEIVSYEGIFSSLLFNGGRFHVEGVLMECDDGNKVIIGDRNFRGNIRRVM